MDLKFKFNANEFAKLNGITPSALRKRRLSGKLEGQYIKKGSDYFYTPSLGHRPNNDEFTLNNSRSKPRRRNVSGSDTRYHKVRNGHQFKLTNDLRQLARINKRLDEEGIAEITDDIIEVAQQRKREKKLKRQQELDQQLSHKNYGRWVNCNNRGYRDVQTKWRPLYEQPRDEYQRYIEENDLKPKIREIY
jgi:hypothetical protein